MFPFCFPGWTPPVLSACLHRGGSPALSPSSWPPLDFLQQVHTLLLGTPVLQGGLTRKRWGQSPPSTCWSRFLWSSSGCSCLSGPHFNNIREAHNRGITNGKNYFLPSKSRGGSVPAPRLGRRGLFNVSHSADPRIISSSNSCSQGDSRARRHTAVPSIATHPSKDCWICLWDQLSSNPIPHELFRTIADFLFFFFLTSTTSVWRKRDAATPRELCLFHCFQLVKLQGDARNTHIFKVFFAF